jgi:hypothetical protein
VTALLGEGALRLDTTDVDRDFLPLQFDWQDSVVAVAPRQALLNMTGHHDAATFKDRLEWDMASTWFDLEGPVWEVFPESDVYLTDLDFRELGFFSESPIVRDVLQRPVTWGADQFELVEARDFRLRNQPRRPQATDGLDAGVRWDGLPEFRSRRSPADLD